MSSSNLGMLRRLVVELALDLVQQSNTPELAEGLPQVSCDDGVGWSDGATSCGGGCCDAAMSAGAGEQTLGVSLPKPAQLRIARLKAKRASQNA